MTDQAYRHHDKVIYEMGHFNVEQLGMKYMLKWLPEALETDDLKIEYVPAKDQYQYIVR